MVFENRNPYKDSLHNGKLRKLQKWPWPLIYAVGAFAAVLVLFLVGIPRIIRWRIRQETQFKNGTDTWDKLVNITVPVFFNVRFFNLTNPDALEKGEKFKLQELGPYVYEEKRVKNITKVNEEEDTLTYFESKTYFFRPDLSNGSESDLVNTINYPYLSSTTVAKKYFDQLSNVVTWALEGLEEDIILRNVPVGGLIFNGMNMDPIYATWVMVSPGGIPKQFVGDTFSYFNGRNGSHCGEVTIMSGIKDYTKLGNTVSWNGKKQLSFWTDKSLPDDQQYCNRMNGSDGSLTPPFMTKDRDLYVFYGMLCRSLLFKFNNESEYEGIPSWLFTPPKDIFARPEVNPDNHCFCLDPGGGLNSECVDGVYRANKCYSDSPFAFSKPHFLDGDQKLIDAVEGLNPTREKHESYMEFEPFSGMILTANVRMQLDVELQPLEGVTAFEHVPHMFLPVMWIEQIAYLDDVNVNFIKNILVIPMEIIKYAQWISFILTGLMLFLAIVHTAKKNLTRNSTACESRSEYMACNSIS